MAKSEYNVSQIMLGKNLVQFLHLRSEKHSEPGKFFKASYN